MPFLWPFRVSRRRQALVFLGRTVLGARDGGGEGADSLHSFRSQSFRTREERGLEQFFGR
jgi:hypothetical protein